MSEAAKPDPSADQTANPGATLVQDQTDLVTKGTTEETPKGEAPKEETKAAPTVTEQVTSTATAVKDNVFSMFGGGPKKEKKEEEDDVDEPSGATKKPAADV